MTAVPMTAVTVRDDIGSGSPTCERAATATARYVYSELHPREDGANAGSDDSRPIHVHESKRAWYLS